MLAMRRRSLVVDRDATGLAVTSRSRAARLAMVPRTGVRAPRHGVVPRVQVAGLAMVPRMQIT
jgi:hypothetical protein